MVLGELLGIRWLLYTALTERFLQGVLMNVLLRLQMH